MENRLKRLKEFQQLLRNYRLSDEHMEFLQSTDLVLLLAPTATGRNTLIHELVDSGKYHFVVSDTTRLPRINNGQVERNGMEYWFRSEEYMLDAIKRGDMVEAEVIHGQQVSGMSISELKRAHESNRIAVTDIDIGGAQSLLKLHPNAKVVLLIPPSFKEWLKRLNGRGHMPIKELRRRLETALRIYQYALDSNDIFIVVNDDIKRAQKIIDRIVHGDSHRRDDELDKLLRELLTDTENWLHNH